MLNSVYFTGRKTLLFGIFSFYTKEELALAIDFLRGTSSFIAQGQCDTIIMGNAITNDEELLLEQKYPFVPKVYEGKIDDFLQEFYFPDDEDSGQMEYIIKLAKLEKLRPSPSW